MVEWEEERRVGLDVIGKYSTYKSKRSAYPYHPFEKRNRNATGAWGQWIPSFDAISGDFVDPTSRRKNSGWKGSSFQSAMCCCLGMKATDCIFPAVLNTAAPRYFQEMLDCRDSL
jgi:hypothetical protein